jgi:hypothetical protein
LIQLSHHLLFAVDSSAAFELLALLDNLKLRAKPLPYLVLVFVPHDSFSFNSSFKVLNYLAHHLVALL